MEVFEFDTYREIEGYCPGKDDISRTVINTGGWEPVESAAALRVLRSGDPTGQLVLDYGSHIGWYSLMAAQLGYAVEGFEADPANMRLANHNAELNELTSIHISNVWVDVNLPRFSLPDRFNSVRFVKIDIEGAEEHAVRSLAELFDAGKIDAAMIEISPVFNDSYPQLVQFLQTAGYATYVIRGEYPYAVFDGNFNFPQENFLFLRPGIQEMM